MYRARAALRRAIREMKILAAVFTAALLALVGCRTSPYDYAENWVVREDAVRQFSVGADVFYLQGGLYTNIATLAEMSSYARSEVGNGRFTGVARVFSPLISNVGDLEMALDWFFDSRASGRPFVFIGECEGGALLKAYEERNSEELKENGLLASYYTANSHEGFVKSWIVREVRDAVAARRYREQWGREISTGASATAK